MKDRKEKEEREEKAIIEYNSIEKERKKKREENVRIEKKTKEMKRLVLSYVIQNQLKKCPSHRNFLRRRFQILARWVMWGY